MTPATLGVVHAAIEALNADYTPERLAGLDPKDLAETWRAAGEICREADALYVTLRQALTQGLIDASNSQVDG